MTTSLHVDRVLSRAPPWLAEAVAQAYMFSIVLPLDGMTEWLYQGIKARFPGLGPLEADALIAEDRKIIRGPAEAREAWATRARGYRQAHKRRGGPFSLLEQLAGHFAPNPPLMRVVTNSGHWYTRRTNGDEEVLAVNARYPAVANNWVWDPLVDSRWWRYWVIIYSPDGIPWTKHAWGDPGLLYGNAGLVWGSSMTKKEAVSIRNIVINWDRAGAYCENIIIPYDASMFEPSGSGAGYPDGTWDQWVNRAQPASYMKGTP